MDGFAQYSGTTCKWTAAALQPLSGITGTSLRDESEDRIVLPVVRTKEMNLVVSFSRKEKYLDV